MSVKMLHTCIRVKNLEASLKFYKDAFNLIETRRKDVKEAKFTLVYIAQKEGDYEIELTYNYDKEHNYEIGNGFSHIAVGTPNIEEMRKKHITLGYKVTELKGLANSPANYYFVTDPDGYQIEVIRTNE